MKLNGRELSEKILIDLRLEIIRNDLKPGLGIIIVGNRPDSILYVNMKKKACTRLGITNYDVYLPEDVSEIKLLMEINKMNYNDKINGILIQLPLPKHLNEERILNSVKVEKDVDGFSATNMGLLALNSSRTISPCTPAGCLELIDYYNIDLVGKDVVVVGCSKIVGMPLGLMLLNREATVQFCHIKTVNLIEKTKLADIVIVGCGVPNLITENHIKEGAIVIDIGINKIKDSNKKRGYRIVGDVDYENVSKKTSYITPVPGGVGPMTISMLMKHTVRLAKEFKYKMSIKNKNDFSSCNF